MQITRRNNQIENETEQNGIKVGDERKLLHKGNKQHTIAQPKGKGRTSRKCSPGRAFPRPLLETPTPKATPFDGLGVARPAKSINLKNIHAFVDISAVRLPGSP